MHKILIGIILFVVFSCSSKDHNGSPVLQEREYTYRDSIEVNQESQTFQDSQPTTNTNFDVLIGKYEDPNRTEWQNPELVLEKLGDLNGKIVADLGAGSGYFTFRMAQTAEKIIAIDIDPRFLSYIEDRKMEFPEDQADKIVTRLTVEDDPSLQKNEVDVVLLVNTFHYIQNRSEYFKKVKNGLKEDGFLVIVDVKNPNAPIGPPEDLIVGLEVAFAELREAGFREFSIDENSLEYQYIMIAK